LWSGCKKGILVLRELRKKGGVIRAYFGAGQGGESRVSKINQGHIPASDNFWEAIERAQRASRKGVRILPLLFSALLSSP
jgi:hypothetical protein